MESIVDKSLRISFEVRSFEDKRVRKCNLEERNNLEAARSIFCWFCSIYRVSGEDGASHGTPNLMDVFKEMADSSKSILEFYIAALRQVFLFCFYCYKKYDTIYDMRLCCGDQHVSTDEVDEDEDMKRAFFRKHDIYMGNKDFCFLKTKSENSELDSFVLRKEADRFKCDCCIKMFSSADFTKNHIRNKHPEALTSVKTKIDDFNRFIDNIDFFMVSCMAGIDDLYPPTFLNLDEKVEGVRYLDKIFSGEVAVDKA